jgi:hypothetical protein
MSEEKIKVVTAKPGYTMAQFQIWGNQMEATYWQGQGETVIQDPETGLYALVGRNAKTGELEPDKAKTTQWSPIETAPDGTEYMYSYGNDPRFENWKQAWAASGLPDCFEEIDMPDEWIPAE